MELSQDLVKEILSRLSVKSLLRFKSVSERWKWTIESQDFKKRLMTSQQSLDPDFLIVDGIFQPDKVCIMRMLVLGSSISIELPCPYPPPRTIVIPAIKIKVPYDNVTNSCDGMICFYDKYGEIFVVNPSTRWYRQVHGARYQELHCSIRERGEMFTTRNHSDGLGFGKDICMGAYKLVWLYTIHRVTTFDTNTWRYVKSSSYEIFEACQEPVYIDGSLHWLINENSPKTRVQSFDFHKETFLRQSYNFQQS